MTQDNVVVVPQASYDESGGEAHALRIARTQTVVLTARTLLLALLQALLRKPHADRDGLRGLCRALIRAGMLSRAAGVAAAAAERVAAAAARTAAIPEPLTSAAAIAAQYYLVAALMTGAWAELVPEVEAAFAASHALQHASRLLVQLLALPRHRFAQQSNRGPIPSQP
jgi:hypothetical protein